MDLGLIRNGWKQPSARNDLLALMRKVGNNEPTATPGSEKVNSKGPVDTARKKGEKK